MAGMSFGVAGRIMPYMLRFRAPWPEKRRRGPELLDIRIAFDPLVVVEHKRPGETIGVDGPRGQRDDGRGQERPPAAGEWSGVRDKLSIALSAAGATPHETVVGAITACPGALGRELRPALSQILPRVAMMLA